MEEVVKQGNKLGLPPQASDAHTINGKPGPLFPCSEKCKFGLRNMNRDERDHLLPTVLFQNLVSCRYIRSGGGAGENIPLQNHQCCTQRRAVLRDCRAQHDSSGDRCCVHEALLEQRDLDCPRADNQRPRTSKRSSEPVFHGCKAFHGRPYLCRQQNCHSHTAIQRNPKHYPSISPSATCSKRQRFCTHLQCQAQKPQLSTVSRQRPTQSRPSSVLHDRPRSRPLPGLPQRDEARGFVEQHHFCDA